MPPKLDTAWHARFATRLKQAREQEQLTQQQLSDLAGLSHFTKVGHYELGRERPSLENFRRIAAVLGERGYSAGWLLGLE